MSTNAENRNRQPKGRPTGGQFAQTTRPDSGISLPDWRRDKPQAMSDLHSRLGELVPGAEVEDRGITTSTGVSSIDLRATTGKVVSDGKPAADVRITGTADAEGNFDHAPTVFISWNETGYDGQAKVETTAYNIRAASVDELEDDLDLNLPRARRQAHLQQEANVEVNQRVAARTAAESGRHAFIVATVSARRTP